VTYDAARWDGEMLWMALYFSLAVWSSLMLGAFVLVRRRLAYYRARPPIRQLTGPRLSARTVPQRRP
jgi:hypothetical protein